MTIGQIGHEFNCLQSIDFASKESLLDYDMIFVNLNHLSEYYAHDSVKNVEAERVLIVYGYESIFKRRAADFLEYLKKGKILVCFTPFYQVLYNSSGIEDYKFSILQLLGLNLEIIHSEGRKISINKNHKLGKLLNEYIDRMHYRGYFPQKNGNVLINVKDDEEKVVSTLIKNNLLFIPFFDKIYEINEELIDKLIEYFFNKDEAFEQPEWTIKYKLPKEEDTKGEILNIENKIKGLKEELTSKEEKLNNIISLKTLFSGTGDYLEKEVERIFKEIGFEMLEADRNRDDLIIKYNDKIAVIEVKGVANSAGEKQAAQLEKWVSEYHLKNNMKPKGILIVNGCKDLELEKRKEPVFPNQMHKFSENREHCLISGTQLLGLYYTIQKDPDRKEELINSLFDTIGVYKGFENWTGFIDYK